MRKVTEGRLSVVVGLRMKLGFCNFFSLSSLRFLNPLVEMRMKLWPFGIFFYRGL